MPKPKARTIGLLAAFVIAVGGTAAPDARESINLNDAHSLESLRLSHPDHYEKIQDILAGLDLHGEREVPGWIETHFGAHDVSYHRPLIGGEADSRALHFVLDGVEYEARLSAPQRVARLPSPMVM